MPKTMKTNQFILLSFLLTITAFGCTNRNTSDQEIAGASADNAALMNETEKENLAIALRFVNEGLQKGDTTAFNECLDKDITVLTGLKPTGPIKGIAEYKYIFTAFIKAWPGISFTVDESFAKGDKVVIRFNSVNVFRGEFFGMKPTNQIASLKEAHIMTLKNGKIVSNIVSATNLEYEYILYPLLKDGVLKDVKTEKQ
jgi:predicted ester cyclase